MLVNWQNRQKQKMTKCVETGANGHQQAQTGKNGKKHLQELPTRGKKLENWQKWAETKNMQK